MAILTTVLLYFAVLMVARRAAYFAILLGISRLTSRKADNKSAIFVHETAKTPSRGSLWVSYSSTKR